MPHAKLIACATALLAAFPATSFALDEQRTEVQSFIREMADRHGFAAEDLGQVFARVETRPSIIDLMTRPAEKSKPWHEYRALFLADKRIARGAETARQQSAALQLAAQRGVPAQYLLAITGVETFYGEIIGRHRVIDALATLAFDYPRRSAYFRGELEQFLLMAREESLDPLAPVGSYAGAMGIPQFMPTSFRTWAVDGDGNGHRDLWGSWHDVFASVANYLAAHGWRAGEPVMARADVNGADLDGLEFGKLALSDTVGSLRKRGIRFDTPLPASAPAVLIRLEGAGGPEFRVGFTNFYAITRYNRSQLYASAVSDLADALAATWQPPVEPAKADQPAQAKPFTSVSSAE
jgi:membrane-bound lytic murein transglycosylase B